MEIVQLATGGSWEKFLLNPASDQTADYSHHAFDNWVQVDITDSFCARDDA